MLRLWAYNKSGTLGHQTSKYWPPTDSFALFSEDSLESRRRLRRPEGERDLDLVPFRFPIPRWYRLTLPNPAAASRGTPRLARPPLFPMEKGVTFG